MVVCQTDRSALQVTVLLLEAVCTRVVALVPPVLNDAELLNVCMWQRCHLLECTEPLLLLGMSLNGTENCSWNGCICCTRAGYGMSLFHGSFGQWYWWQHWFVRITMCCCYYDIGLADDYCCVILES
jgi:hypothetical protein